MMPWTSGASVKRGASIIVAIVALIAVTGGVHAADAEQLFESARGDMKRGEFAAAREKLLDSLQLEETAGTLFNLGLCEEKLGRLADALEHLRAAHARADENDKRRPIMTTLIGSLELRVGRLVLRRAEETGPPLQVTLDGRAVQVASEGQEVVVDAGEHQVVVQGPSGPPLTTAIQVKEGETVVKAIDWHPEPAIPTPPDHIRAPVSAPPAPSGPARLDERLGAVALNVGAAAVIAGAALGFMTMGSKISVDHHCTSAGCDDEGRRASAAGSSYSTASTALTVTGLLGLGVGSYALRRPDPASRARATPRERTVGYFAGAVGAAALITSVVASGVALSAKRDLLDRCGDSGPCDDPQGLDAASRGRIAAPVATVALGVGVVALGVASYSLLIRPRFVSSNGMRVSIGPSAVACAVRF